MLAVLLLARLRHRLRSTLRDRSMTTVLVAGPGGFYDIVQVHYSQEKNEIWLDIEKRDSR